MPNAGTLRPFHETIIDVIRSASDQQLECLAVLIKATKIPSNHDRIIAAWNQRSMRVKWMSEGYDVQASLLAQKQRVEAENAVKVASAHFE